MPEPQSLISLSKEILTYLVHAFGAGTLTTTGVQYGSSGVSTSTDVWKVVETQTIQPFTQYFGSIGSIIEVEFALAANAQWSSTDGTGGVVTYAWQAKNLSDTSTDSWVWLMPTSSGLSTAIGSTAGDTSVLSGRMSLSTTFNKVPFQVRLLLCSGGKGSDTGGASSTGAYVRAKSSSYVKVLYRVE